MRIGVDVDGVLAQFDPAFLALLNLLHSTAKSFAPLAEPTCWAWMTDQLNFTEDQVETGWRWVRANPYQFWRDTVRPYPVAITALRILHDWSCQGDCVYFITSRQLDLAKHATEEWLSRLGYPGATVLLSDRKGDLARGLDLDAAIDDRVEFLADMHAHSGIDAYLVRRPHNLHAALDFCVTPVRDVLEALHLIGAPNERPAHELPC